MVAGERMFGGVTVWGTVTTKRGFAGLTRAQVNPECANLDALLALAHLRESNLRYRFDVPARLGIHDFLLTPCCRMRLYLLPPMRFPIVLEAIRFLGFFFVRGFPAPFICSRSSENSKPNSSLILALRAGNTSPSPTVDRSATILSAKAITGGCLPRFVFL